MAMDDVLAVILGGGRGTRLFPLTLQRSKPAVPIAGKYRLIDIPISNCLNSDLRRIFVLTQFNSESLNKHIASPTSSTSSPRPSSSVLAAEQTEESGDWFQGTADAVRQSLRHMRRTAAKRVLILSGDQLYQMDYRQMLDDATASSGADATVAVTPVTAEQASAFGILKMDARGRIVHFDEKPPRAAARPGLRGCPGGGPRLPRLDGHLLLPARRSSRIAGRPEARRLRPPRHPRRGAPPARAGPRLPRLLGGRRDHPVVLPGQPRPVRRDPAVRFLRRDAARSTPTRASCPRPSSSGCNIESALISKAASCTAPRSSAPSSASAAASAPGAQIRNSLIMGADYYETLRGDARRPTRAACRRSASAPTRSSRTPSSTRTRASAGACASSTRPASRRRTATATSSAKAS